MKYNTDINILGGLPDWNLINIFLKESIKDIIERDGIHTHTSIKTSEAVKRFERAISRTFLQCKNNEIQHLLKSILHEKEILNDTLFMLFWNGSVNNELLHYLNMQVYFPAFYSGRLVLKKEEASACVIELKETEQGIKNWTIETINTIGRKYLTLLKKFNLMEGSQTKTIVHPYLNDKMFVLFVYWITAIESKSNLLDSEWLEYSFFDRPVFVERLMQKKFSNYFQFLYTGDKLNIETLVPYSTIYHDIK